ncbi:PREDICTED: putative late blight resistance protein homolog R1B-23 isoform X2 [Ipomoea nil]|uniref:putative late blight resistance protein homolog R1B-23 isoform X2 n=1 Tax=Ipomoea nil TaxID=35883 RepID=UPI0009018B3B|nr:PREDICTED: putative late blight resistance protein homolog R1B-23 isoform X2 [Ipomoea nil]
MNCLRRNKGDMGIGEKASVECVFTLSWLQAIGDQMDLSVQLRDQIQTLRLQLQLLNNILMCTEHCSEDLELNYFLEDVGEVVSDIHSSLFNISYGKIQEFDSIVMNALENMNVIKTDIVLIHVLFSKLSCSRGQMSDGILLEFLEMSTENLKGLMKSKADLLAPLKQQIEILEKKLRLLRNFFHFARNGYIEHENLGHLATVIGAVVYKLGCLGALYWIDEMDDDMASRLRLKLCQLLQKIELVMPEVKLILIKFQKASMLLQSNKTTVTDKLLWDFVYFIIENLKEFIKGMEVSDDQVESLYVEFGLLRTSLINQQRLVKKLLSESYRVYIRSNCAIKMVDLLTRTEAVSKEAATIMNSFGIHDTSDEDRALGINFSCFDLLEKFISFRAEGMQDLQSHIMKQRENSQPPKYDPLNCLECQEKHKGLSAELKDAIQRLKMKFGYLQLILRRWSGEDCDFGIITEVIKATSPYCHKACVAIKYGKLDSALLNLTSVLSYVNNNEELRLRVKEAKNRFQVSSSSSVMTMPVQLAGDFVDFLIKNVVYLLHYNLYFISSAKKKMEVFEAKLRFLRGFLNFTSKWCIESEKLKKLLTRIGTMADNAAHLSYWCFDDEVKEQMADEVKLITSYLLEMIFPIDVEVREIYPQVLKASESSLPETPTRAELVVAFVDSLMANLMDLHNGKVCGMIPRWESWQIQTLCQGLGFLKAMIKDLSDQCVEHNTLNNLLMYIETEVSKIRPGTMKMNVGVLNFLVVIKLIKTDIYLKDVESSKTILTVSLKEETSTMSKELKSLITDVLGLEDYYANLDKLNDYLRHIEAVGDQLQSVRYLFCMQNVNEDTDRMMHFAMFEFRVKIRTIKAEVSLVKLLDKIPVPVKDKIETLQEELQFLVNHLGQYSEPEKLNDLLIGIDDIVTQTGTTIDSFNLNESNKEIASKVNIGISGLLEKIELLKKNSQQICHRFPDLRRTYVPRTAVLCFIDYLIEKLKQFLDCKGNVISQLKNQIERVQGELMSVRYLIGEVAQGSYEHEELKDLFTRSLYVAYEVEYVVGLSSSGIGDTFLYHRLRNATNEIILAKTKFKEIYEKKNGVSSNSFIITDKIQGASNVNSGIVDDVVVGFEDVVDTILEKLVRGSSQRDVISIVGMTGIGKTTVARKIYNICVNEHYFDVCSWCRVSTAYVKKELLVDLLCQIVELPDKIDDMPEDALSDKLRKGLLEKRYLIIIDDIWSTKEWEYLQRHFPDDNSGSRIIITTQMNEVAQNAKSYSNRLSLRPLDHKESWTLLQEKLQYEETHQPDLVDIGKQIAKKCHGLPLSVVLVAGLLSRVEKTPGCWRQVSESLSVVGGTRTTYHAIELSYKHLPEHLKRCFLYFGVFSEDKEIPVSKLTRLWIAEGFVLEKDTKSSEEVAEEYLMDLIGRNLVINSKTTSRGRVKACQVHDAVRNFCLLKSKEEDFLQRVPETDSPHSFPQKPEQHRVFVFSEQEDFANWRPSDLPVRSLLFKAVSYVLPCYSFDISFVLSQFKLLLVLDLWSLNMDGSFPREMQFLIHLRYLAVRIDTNTIPSFIDNLRNLETFLVKGRRGEIALPDTLWNMVRLRHLHVDNRASFALLKDRKEFYEYSYQLENLKTFSSPILAFEEDSRKIMRRLPNLQKLRCWFVESWESYPNRFKGKCNRFPALDFLAQLESLKVFYCGHQVLHPCEFNFPSNLKKLTLSNFRLPWIEISKLAMSLPNLEVLDLKFRACNDKLWEVGYGEFPKLKILKLDRLNIEKWKAPEDAFPRLQHLVLQKCKHLEEIPESMDTLQTIDVQWCTHSAVKSAIKIWKDQRELGNDGFKVSIQPLDCDPRASPLGFLFNSE